MAIPLTSGLSDHGRAGVVPVSACGVQGCRRKASHWKSRTKKNHDFSWFFLYSGSPTWTRTRDLRINSPSLYQLSYQGKEATLYIPETALSNF
jgi:hypothetical protein